MRPAAWITAKLEFRTHRDDSQRIASSELVPVEPADRNTGTRPDAIRQNDMTNTLFPPEIEQPTLGPCATPQAPRPKLGVVTPLANEESNIREFLRRVLIHLQNHDRVYCVLDNACNDRTRNIVEEISKRDQRVVLVWAPENRSIVDAYFRGYRTAFDDGCEWILEMDAGFSHLPEELSQFINGMIHGYDYVGGSRFMAGGRHRSPWTRVLVSWGGCVLSNLLLQTRMTDMTSGFECFNRKAMSLLLQQGVASKANFFQTEIRFAMHQFHWLEVPITYQNHNYRLGRSSLREAICILWQLYRNQRLYSS
jgi:dolichol-phosphate mannosyltransferase